MNELPCANSTRRIAYLIPRFDILLSMKAFIFDPLWDELITDELQKKIEASGLELHVTKEISPISERELICRYRRTDFVRQS